jgi:hypothetical protein
MDLFFSNAKNAGHTLISLVFNFESNLIECVNFKMGSILL